MTISNENVKQTFNGDGGTTSFPFSIVYFDNAEILVYLRDTTTGVETLQTETTHYTITDGVDDGYRVDGGTIDTTFTPSATEQIIVVRELDIRQDDFDPAPTASYQPELVEVTFDRLVAMIQQITEELARTITTSIGSGITDLVLPVEANKFIKWNAAGTALEVADIDLTTLSTQVSTNASDIGTLQASLNALTLTVSGLNALIVANAAAIVANTGLIGNNSAAISTNSSDITTNANDITAVKNRLNALESFLGTSGSQEILNNTTDEALTDMLFDGDDYRSIIIEFTLARKTDTGSKYSSGNLYLIFSDETGTWRIEKGLEVLDYAGVTFTIDAVSGKIGQTKYTSNDLAGTAYSGTIYYNIKKFEV